MTGTDIMLTIFEGRRKTEQGSKQKKREQLRLQYKITYNRVYCT